MGMNIKHMFVKNKKFMEKSLDRNKRSRYNAEGKKSQLIMESCIFRFLFREFKKVNTLKIY